MSKFAGLLGKLRRPIRIVDQLVVRNPLAWLARSQMDERAQKMPCHVGESRPQLDGFFGLADLPAIRVVIVKEGVIEAAVRLLAQPGRRHELRVSVDGIIPLAAAPAIIGEQPFPSG
jgi:hypothetical protein